MPMRKLRIAATLCAAILFTSHSKKITIDYCITLRSKATLRCSILFMFIIWVTSLKSQNTVGLLSFDPDLSYPGFNLIYPHNQSTVFLINACGELIRTWTDEPDYRPGNAVYLREDGTLVKTKRKADSNQDPIWFGGGGETVEIRDWDNNLMWSFSLNDSMARLHHDVAPMSNGNILMIAWERKTGEEAMRAGRDPSLLTDGDLLPEFILEMNPELDSIVWKWHVWDHLIQDFDPSKENFGDVAAHPELIDLNYDTNNGIRDWLHCNAIDYNADLDQIMLCIPTFGEFWIIDHSTTTQEAAGHTGGKSGKGGDLLYRWGNPQSYQQGTVVDQKLFFPHDAHWVDQHLSSDHPEYGKILVFNNRVQETHSTVELISNVFDPISWSYPLSDLTWEPREAELTILHPDTFPLHSTAVSGAQILSNSNMLILSGRTGYAFELTTTGEVVWEYKVPLMAGLPVSQGDTLSTNQNFTFRINRYPENFPAFESKDPSPIGYIELLPNTNFCMQITDVEESLMYPAFVYPNPADDYIWVRVDEATNVDMRILDHYGRNVQSVKMQPMESTRIQVDHLMNGIYLLELDGRVQSRFLVVH